ncbi:MRGRD protein, partial [Amazona guildingii]|nr:MRGRD protein [Amazona guildingii]
DTNTTGLHLNCTHHGNWSSESDTGNRCVGSFDGYMVFLIVCMLICVFGMVGNGIVLWFLGFQMKRNHFTVYILNVAAADCSLLLLFFLFTLGYFNIRIICCDLDSFIPFFCKFVDAIEFLCHFFVLTSLGLLTAISMERCISVV